MYGLSLSFCVTEIMRGKVSEDEVVSIIASTRFDSPEQALEHYGYTYWHEFDQEETTALVKRLWSKVVQPRLHGYDAHNISAGYWLETADNDYPVMVAPRMMIYKWVKASEAGDLHVYAKMDGATFASLED
jgi:hypothetical protein